MSPKTVIKLFLSCTMAMTLTSCDMSYKTEAKQFVQENMRDPESVKWGEIAVHHYTGPVSGKKRKMVCGLINAKNGMGGYIGMTRFMYINNEDTGGRPEAVLESLALSSDDSDAFKKSWSISCGGMRF